VPSLVVSGYRLPGLSVRLLRVYRRHHASLEVCERDLLRNRALEGAVAARLTIDADGRVVESRVDGSGALGAAARCVLKVMASWRLPAPELGAPASLSFPLVVLRQQRPGRP
jgi:hypothetical protein